MNKKEDKKNNDEVHKADKRFLSPHAYTEDELKKNKLKKIDRLDGGIF